MDQHNGYFWVSKANKARALQCELVERDGTRQPPNVLPEGGFPETSALVRPSADTKIHEHLKRLGEGLDWPLWGLEQADAIEHIRTVAARTPVFDRALGQSPILPESTALLAQALDAYLPPSSSLLVRPDLDFFAVYAASRGQPTTFWGVPSPSTGLLEHDSHLTHIHEPIQSPIPSAMFEAFDGALIDLFPLSGFLLAESCRIVSCVKPGGVIAFVAHCRQRHNVEALLGILPLSLEEKCFELVPRYGPGYTLQDEHWDLWIARREKGHVMYPANKPLPRSGGERVDLDDMLVWASEMHGFAGAFTQEEHLEPALQWLQDAGVIHPIETKWTQAEDHTHVFVALQEGCFLSLTAHRHQHFLALALRGWTPVRHMQIASALYLFGPPQRTILFDKEGA